MIKVIYTGELIPNNFKKSIFLAGPSLRPGQEGISWRNEAISLLEKKQYDGVVFCPEPRNMKFDHDFDYDSQIEWEEKCLNIADCILFWVPRDLSLDNNGNLKLPAFTTNVEFGRWCYSGKVVFGAPDNAEKNKYLIYYSNKLNIPVSNTLSDLLDKAITYLGNGMERSGGECFVPLMIWRTKQFQNWYQAQKEAGNRLDHAELLWCHRPQFKDFIYLYALKVNVFVASENRNKTIEFVLSRIDISSVVLIYKESNFLDSKVILIREFRSPSATSDGFIRELPGGSSIKYDSFEAAVQELYEETGFSIDPSRLKQIGSRQLLGTLSSHKSHLFGAEISLEELKWFESQKDIVHGNEKDSERTYIEIYSVKELLINNNVDWSTLGMICAGVIKYE